MRTIRLRTLFFAGLCIYSRLVCAEVDESHLKSLCNAVSGPPAYDDIELQYSTAVDGYIRSWGAGELTFPQVLKLPLNERAYFGSKLIKSDDASDEMSAIKILDGAAAEGSMLALENLGVYYGSLEGDKFNYGMKLLHCAAEKKGVLAATFLGNYYGFVPGSEPMRAVPFLETAVEGGSELAKLQLAMWLVHGRHVEKNVPRAAELFKQSAEAGYIQAAYMYAYLLEVGYETIEPNLDQAITWYMRAAEGRWRKGPPEAARVLILQGKVEAARKILEEEVRFESNSRKRAEELLNSLSELKEK